MSSRNSQVVGVHPSAHADYPARQAAIEFLRGTAFGWGKRELAHWLVCHYSPCLVVDATRHPDAPGAAALEVTPNLDEPQLERLVLDARASTLKLLADLPWPTEAAAHVDAALGAGHVIAMCDAQGERHWAPVGRRRMRLAQRVASLLIADYMERPQDYLTTSLCRGCGELVFGSKDEHAVLCEGAWDAA
jgi:hypothetical protein